jgi:hypothetical protein
MKNLVLYFIFFNLVFMPLFAQQAVDSVNVKRVYTNLKDALSNPDKVYRLDLSNQKLEPAGIKWQKFKNLEYLSLKNDNLKVLPKELFQMILKTYPMILKNLKI